MPVCSDVAWNILIDAESVARSNDASERDSCDVLLACACEVFADRQPVEWGLTEAWRDHAW